METFGTLFNSRANTANLWTIRSDSSRLAQQLFQPHRLVSLFVAVFDDDRGIQR